MSDTIHSIKPEILELYRTQGYEINNGRVTVPETRRFIPQPGTAPSACAGFLVDRECAVDPNLKPIELHTIPSEYTLPPTVTGIANRWRQHNLLFGDCAIA